MARKLMILTAAALALLLAPSEGSAEQVYTSARACIVIDARSGQVLLEHNADEQLPMASTTKVMTALLALEYGQLDERVTTGRNAFGVPGTSIYLDLGETLTLREMLTGLMLASGNDAAVAIAEHIGGTVEEFCARMTARAAELGCTGTVFLTPHGLPQEGHFTTARDLAIIAREAMSHPEFRELVSTRRACIPWEGRDYDRVLNNKNKLLATYEGATGIKTGYTKAAGRCLVFGAKRDGLELIGVVLNCCDWFDEAARLMDLAFAHYHQVTMLCAGDPVRTLPVRNGLQNEVSIVVSTDLSGAVPRDALPSLCIELPEEISAPVHAGQAVGQAQLLFGGTVVGRADLTAAQTIGCDDFATRWHTFWDGWPLAQ